jgi:hypothetical protein
MVMRRGRRTSAHLVTEAQRSRSEDISYRERRYLIMMAIRVVCFVIAVIVFAKGGGWLTAIPAVGAIVIPYFAVVFANGGREPSSTKGFRAYEPNLPAPYRPAGGDAAEGGVRGHASQDRGHDDSTQPPGIREERPPR